jgi:YhcH/YjgK/YiaL family protein
MIVTDLAHAREQIRHTPAMQKALDFLGTVRGQELADGRIEIDGSRVYALVQSYRTVLPGDPLSLEVHRKYIDVQYVMAGHEVIGWAPDGRLTVTSDYEEGREAWFGTVAAGQAAFVWMAAGDLAVLYPTDGHAPRLAAGGPSAVKKIVVKVAVDG